MTTKEIEREYRLLLIRALELKYGHINMVDPYLVNAILDTISKIMDED